MLPGKQHNPSDKLMSSVRKLVEALAKGVLKKIAGRDRNLWVLTHCSQVEVCQSFKGYCCLVISLTFQRVCKLLPDTVIKTSNPAWLVFFLSTSRFALRSSIISGVASVPTSPIWRYNLPQGQLYFFITTHFTQTSCDLTGSKFVASICGLL